MRWVRFHSPSCASMRRRARPCASIRVHAVQCAPMRLLVGPTTRTKDAGRSFYVREMVRDRDRRSEPDRRSEVINCGANSDRRSEPNTVLKLVRPRRRQKVINKIQITPRLLPHCPKIKNKTTKNILNRDRHTNNNYYYNKNKNIHKSKFTQSAHYTHCDLLTHTQPTYESRTCSLSK